MISERSWEEGWKVLAARWKTDATPTLAAVYLEQLEAELDDQQWEAACKRVVRTQDFFPKIQTLIDAAIPPADEQGEAAKLFRTILNHPEYLPNRGSYFNAHAIEAKYGRAAAHAFVESGGERRWDKMSDSDTAFVLKDFTLSFLRLKQHERIVGELEALGVPRHRIAPSEQEVKKLEAVVPVKRFPSQSNGKNGASVPTRIGEIVPSFGERAD